MDKSAKHMTRHGMNESHPPVDLNYKYAQSIIENFSSFNHTWKPDQEEILYAMDGIIISLPVDVISRKIHKSPNWIRNIACCLLSLHQHDDNHSVQLTELSERLPVNIDEFTSIHWLFTYWGSLLPERRSLFQWILSNQPQHRDDRINQIIRLEHLYWSKQNQGADKTKKSKGDQLRSAGLPAADTLIRFSLINESFKELKRDLRENNIEPTMAKDMLERLNLILISYNLIRDELLKYL